MWGQITNVALRVILSLTESVVAVWSKIAEALLKVRLVIERSSLRVAVYAVVSPAPQSLIVDAGVKVQHDSKYSNYGRLGVGRSPKPRKLFSSAPKRSPPG